MDLMYMTSVVQKKPVRWVVKTEGRCATTYNKVKLLESETKKVHEMTHRTFSVEARKCHTLVELGTLNAAGADASADRLQCLAASVVDPSFDTFVGDVPSAEGVSSAVLAPSEEQLEKQLGAEYDRHVGEES